MTRFVLVTTTINVPTVLALYRQCDQNTEIVVVGDRRTPPETADFCRDIGAHYIDQHSQHAWNCSEPIGWGKIQRRNIGFLVALRDGADVVVTIDDDNAPLTPDYFQQFYEAFFSRRSRLSASGVNGWIDPGQYLVPPIPQRGFPREKVHALKYTPVTDVKVGAAGGLILGDSDMDAVTRMANRPIAFDVAMLGRTGVVVDPKSWTILNSQNTAILREFVPAFFLFPFVGRYDDLYASLVLQRVMRDRDYHVHLGPPFVYQERNEHSLTRDLRGEIDGMERIVEFADVLEHTILPGKSVIGDVRWIYNALRAVPWFPIAAVDAGLAFLEDCERVL